MKFNLKKATSSLSEIKFRILWLYQLKPEIKILKLRKPEINLFLGSRMTLRAQRFILSYSFFTNKSCLCFISMLGSGKPNGIMAKFWIGIETVKT